MASAEPYSGFRAFPSSFTRLVYSRESSLFGFERHGERIYPVYSRCHCLTKFLRKAGLLLSLRSIMLTAATCETHSSYLRLHKYATPYGWKKRSARARLISLCFQALETGGGCGSLSQLPCSRSGGQYFTLQRYISTHIPAVAMAWCPTISILCSRE